MRFAISKTTDPATGGWWVYAAPNTTSLDQDKIESTSDKFIIAGNTDTNEQIYVYNLSQVTSGVTHPQVKKLTATKSNLYEAAVEQTSASPGYLVASFPGQPLDLATITGTPAAPTSSSRSRRSRCRTSRRRRSRRYPAVRSAAATWTAGSTTPSTSRRPQTASR